MEFWLAIRMIIRNKKKIYFPFASVIIGISSLIVILSIFLGGKKLISENLSYLSENRIIIGNGIFFYEDLSLLENYPFIEYAFFPQSVIKKDDLIIYGYSQKALLTLGLDTLNKNELIIDKNQYPNLKKEHSIKLKIGEYTENFFIKDFYEEKNPLKLAKKGKRIILSQKKFQEISQIYEYNSILISFKKNENYTNYINNIINILKNKRIENKDIKILETPELYINLTTIELLLKKILFLVSIMSILLVAAGNSNLVNNNIRYKSNYIGILMSFGMKKTRIIKTFILENLIVSTLGFIIGIIIGFMFSKFIGNLLKIQPYFNFYILCLSFLILLVISIFSGIYLIKKIQNQKEKNILKGE